LETLILSAKHRMWLQFPLCPFYEKRAQRSS